MHVRIVDVMLVKKLGFYIATAQIALHFAPPPPTRQTSHTAITREDYSLTFPPLSIARYSFIQLSGLRHSGDNENAQTSKW